jgi:hypothetical protein
LAGSAAAQSSYSLRSPDKRIEVRIRTAGSMQYDVLVSGKVLLQNSTLSINVDQTQLGRNVKVKAVKEGSVDRMLEPQVRQKFAKIRENYNELRIDAEDGLAVVFRAYNEGAAYRLETSLSAAQVKVYGEEAGFNFAGDYTVFYPQEESFFSHNERLYTPRKLKEIAPAAIATLPAVVDVDGVKVAIAESDIEDYPRMWLRGTSGNGLAAVFPPYPLKETLERDRDYKVTQAADYIATTKGTRTYPWRLMGIAEKDGDLITNPLVWLLAKPTQVPDASWIKPGKVAWDWWNANNIYGVDFKSGVNTQTYKYYIDFYHDLARETAKRKLLLDFHGVQRSATMTRTWPNLIGNEGVKGMENSKWSVDDDPVHNVTLPFTRMFLGPMDFTPGAMLNATKTTFAQVYDRPMAMGTRCHQLAMYVVYESPLQMLADSPSNYMREPEAMEFLGPVPSVWDETRVLDAKIAEYVVVARRNGRDWYIGAMTNWTPRDLEIDLSFLPVGTLRMEAYQDGVNAGRMAGDYKLVKSQVNRNARMKIHLAEGGGWAARIHP